MRHSVEESNKEKEKIEKQQRCAASPYIRNGNSVQTVTSNTIERT